ncbi:MAG: hypothetical protein K2O18_14195 [Oscillospiraceae bacterium]|nr:hypothetical protein [Oscillospiraceae bacterium]
MENEKCPLKPLRHKDFTLSLPIIRTCAIQFSAVQNTAEYALPSGGTAENQPETPGYSGLVCGG